MQQKPQYYTSKGQNYTYMHKEENCNTPADALMWVRYAPTLETGAGPSRIAHHKSRAILKSSPLQGYRSTAR